MSDSGRMKNEQSVEAGIQPMDVSIRTAPDSGGPVLMGSTPKELRGIVLGH